MAEWGEMCPVSHPAASALPAAAAPGAACRLPLLPGVRRALPVLARELPSVLASLPTAGARLELPGPFPQGWEGLGGNREWRQGELACGAAGEPAGLGLSWRASLDRPFRGAGLVLGRRGAEGPGQLSLPPWHRCAPT